MRNNFINKGNIMIKFEHINLVVKDMQQTLAFYQVAFPHWKIRCEGDSDWYGTPRHWLHFGDDFQYIAFSDNGQGENRDLMSHQLGLAHFAFVTNNLNQLVKRMSESGYEIAKPGSNAKYRNNCYYIDPNGYEIEFVEYLSDIPEQRNSQEES